MENQQEFALAMKSRLALEIGNLVINGVEAKASCDVLAKQLQEAQTRLAASEKSSNGSEHERPDPTRFAD